MYKNYRTKYRALTKTIDEIECIILLEENTIDPAASIEKKSEILRNDPEYNRLLGEIRDIFSEVRTHLENKQRSSDGVLIRKLRGKVNQIRKQVTEREKHVKGESLVYAGVPVPYIPVEEEEYEDVVKLLKSKKANEFLTVDKEITKTKER